MYSTFSLFAFFLSPAFFFFLLFAFFFFQPAHCYRAFSWLTSPWESPVLLLPAHVNTGHGMEDEDRRENDTQDWLKQEKILQHGVWEAKVVTSYSLRRCLKTSLSSHQIHRIPVTFTALSPPPHRAMCPHTHSSSLLVHSAQILLCLCLAKLREGKVKTVFFSTGSEGLGSEGRHCAHTLGTWGFLYSSPGSPGSTPQPLPWAALVSRAGSTHGQ